jgi:hypothetical protein
MMRVPDSRLTAPPPAPAEAALDALVEALVRVSCARAAQADESTKAIVRTYLLILLLLKLFLRARSGEARIEKFLRELLDPCLGDRQKNFGAPGKGAAQGGTL